MSFNDPIGGYFGLELGTAYELPMGAVPLNSGRSCFEYVLEAANATQVYLPKFTCDVMLEPLERLNVPYQFYSINERLEIAGPIQLAKGEMLVYTNYFGLKGDYALELGRKYGDQLILDCSHAFYFRPLSKGHTFYSPRKFFGLPDGGLLFTKLRLKRELPLDVSYDRVSHLIKRIDLSPQAGYEDFKRNDAALSGLPIRQMSQLTKAMMASLDTAEAKQRREENFRYLHHHLSARNQLKLNLDSVSGPMVYPYLTGDPDLREHLVDNQVFVATYWPNVLQWAKSHELEHQLTINLLPLPVDQRYDTSDISRILDLLP